MRAREETACEGWMKEEVEEEEVEEEKRLDRGDSH